MYLKSDFIIVGGGIVGCATALELALQGARVTILDRGGIGSESSWAGGGILSPLLPWDYLPPVTRLAQWSTSLYLEWVSGLLVSTGVDPEFSESGMLVLPPFDAEKAQDWCQDNDWDASRVATQSVMPELTQYMDSLWLPKVNQVRNPLLIKALVSRLEMLGVEIRPYSQVSAIEYDGNRVSAMKVAGERVSACQYIVAGGAWSKEMFGTKSGMLNIKPIRGQMLLFKLEPGALSHIVLQSGVYLIPRRDGHILVGSTLEDVGFDKSTTKEAAKQLHSAAARIFPRLQHENPVKHWAGLRPGSPDNIPIIARHPDIENLYVNSGHFRYGVTMAPGSAKILSNMIFDKPQPFDVSPYGWPSGMQE